MSDTLARFEGVAHADPEDRLDGSIAPGKALDPSGHRELTYQHEPWSPVHPHHSLESFFAPNEGTRVAANASLAGRIATLSVDIEASRMPTTGDVIVEEGELPIVNLNWSDGDLWLQAASQEWEKVNRRERFEYDDAAGIYAIFRENPDSHQFDLAAVVSEVLPTSEFPILYRECEEGGVQIQYGLFRHWVQGEKFDIMQSAFFKGGKAPRFHKDGSVDYNSVGDLDIPLLAQIKAAALRKVEASERDEEPDLNDEEEDLLMLARSFPLQGANPILRFSMFIDQNLMIMGGDTKENVRILERDPRMKQYFLECAAQGSVLAKLASGMSKYPDGKIKWQIAAVIGSADLADERHGLRRYLYGAAGVEKPEDATEGITDKLHGSLYVLPYVSPNSSLHMSTIFNEPGGIHKEGEGLRFSPTSWPLTSKPFINSQQVLDGLDGETKITEYLAGFAASITMKTRSPKLERLMVLNVRKASGVLARAIAMGEHNPWLMNYDPDEPSPDTLEDMMHRRGRFGLGLGKRGVLYALGSAETPIAAVEAQPDGTHVVGRVALTGEEICFYATPSTTNPRDFSLESGKLSRNRNNDYGFDTPVVDGMPKVVSFFVDHHGMPRHASHKVPGASKGDYSHVGVMLPSPYHKKEKGQLPAPKRQRRGRR